MAQPTLNKNIILLGWVSFFTDMASAMVTPILPIFILVVLHQGADKVGLMVAVATFVSYAIRLFSGYLSDRYDIVKPLVVSGYVLSAISKPLFGLVHSWQGVTTLASLERLGKGIRSAPKDVLLAGFTTEKREGFTFGFHKMMDIAGEFSGSLLLFCLLWYFGQSESVLRSLFLITIVPGIIGVILVAFFVSEPDKTSQKSRPESPGIFAIVSGKTLTPKDKSLLPTLFIHFLFVFFMFDAAFFTLRAHSVGVSTMLIPLLFMVSTGVQTVSSLAIGKKVDDFGAQKVLVFAYAMGVVALILLVLENTLFLWLGYAFLGLFTVASLNAIRSLIAQQAENKGSVYGIFYAGIAIFAALGAYLSGLIWHHWGANSAITFAVAGTGCSMLLVLIRSIWFKPIT
jgi:MFS family permease